VEPQVATDRLVAETAPLEDPGGPQRSGGDDDLRGTDDEPSPVVEVRFRAGDPLAFDEDPSDSGVRHDPGAVSRGVGEVDPERSSSGA